MALVFCSSCTVPINLTQSVYLHFISITPASYVHNYSECNVMSLSASKAQVTPQLSSHTTRVLELLPSDMQLILCFLQTKCVTTALSSK